MVQTPTAWEPLFQVNTIDSTANGEDQKNPVVTGLANGNFVVIWQSDAVSTASHDVDIKGQIYDYLGNKVGSEFRVNSANFFDDQLVPEVAATDDGGFVVVFQDDVGGAGTYNIIGKRFDDTGSLTNTSLIASTADEETSPTVTAFSDGSYLVAYEDDSTGNSNVNGVIVSAGDVVGTEFSIGADTDNETSPVADTLSNNNAVVAYLDPNAGNTSDVRVVFEIYDSSGSLVVGETAATTNGAINREPHVAALAGGGFVLTWTDPDIDGKSDGITAAIYDNAGGLVLAPFLVNNNTNGSQNEPRVTALADGGFVIIWDDDNSNLVRGQRFDAAGNEVGNQFSMNQSNETSPDIAGLSDGRFITVFESGAAGNADVYGQIWDPRDTTISGTFGADAIASRVESSNISTSFGDDTISGLGGDDTINGSFGDDLIMGGQGNDSLLGSFNDDTLLGDAGNDTLDGGADNDTLLGGTGMDSLIGGTGTDFLDGGGSNDTLLGGDDNDTLEGDVGNDELRGEEGNDSLDGGGGMDVLIGREGEDTLDGGIGNDTASGGDGDDSLLGGNGADRLSGQNDNDTVRGGTSDDTLFGAAGNDTLDGDGGADSVSGGIGGDTLFGDTGADTLRGDADNDFVLGEGGHDSLKGGTGNDFVTGGAGNDYIEGNGGNDTLYGGDGGSGNGEDTLIGGGGDDFLVGDNQDDTLTGNSGDDIFYFIIGDDNDVITDFVAGGTDDEIRLDGFGTDFDTFNEVLEAATQVGNDTVIDFGNGDTITLLGVDKADLTAADFVFI